MERNILESVRCLSSLLKEHVCQMCLPGSMTLAAPHGTPGYHKYPDEINLSVITKGKRRNELETLGTLSMLWNPVVEAEASQGWPVHSTVSSAICSFTEFSQMKLGLAALSALFLPHHTVCLTFSDSVIPTINYDVTSTIKV